jgi:thiol-disulfide isomerase/thioredoxin
MSRPRFALSALALAAAVAAACAGPPEPRRPVESAPRAVEASRFHVLLVSGGGNPWNNQAAHLEHVRVMRELALSAGIKPENVTIFASDGADPAPDLSVHDPGERDLWLLHGTKLERPLAAPRKLVDSQIPGARLEPAKRQNIAAWFEQAKTRLVAGDVVFLFVTDHGKPGGADPLDTSILLWGGKDERLTARDLGAMIASLPAGVRVVSLMSQCFSGGFATMSAERVPASGPAVCGYFSAPADRTAYGCYLDHRVDAREGHALAFARRLVETRRMEAAHAAVLVDDDTIDAPLKSTDFHLATLLKRKASERGVAFGALVDELLAGWRDDPAWQSERALVDRIAAAHGVEPPRTFAEIEAFSKQIPELQKGFDTSSRLWTLALGESASDNLKAFLDAHPAWAPRVEEPATKSLDPAGLRALAGSLLGELGPWTKSARGDALERLQRRAETARKASFRTEVRGAAAARIATILTTIAGRAYLAKQGSAEERAAFEALRACEDLELPGAPAATFPPAPAARAPVPPLAEDRALDGELRPAWPGFAWREAHADQKKRDSLPEGASVVVGVYPDSPAAAAGIEPGDLLLGAPGRPFEARHDLRAWTMEAPVGAPLAIEIARGGKRSTVTLTPRPLPLTLPALPPAPPIVVGEAAPPADLVPFRGPKINLKDGKPHLLFFWATWCVPCKTALPEVLAFEREKKTQVVAVTDEEGDVIRAFFGTFHKPFPQAIDIDESHKVFDAYGAKARPTFVLVDGQGIVRARTSGYDAAKGLGIEGWSYRGK